MDRSYLSDPDVVSASRDFVCVRLVTFEDAEEMALLALFEGEPVAPLLIQARGASRR